MKTKHAKTETYLPVVFRRWRGEPKTVIALFPTIPADVNGYQCASYEHIGQHGGATLLLTSSNTTRPVDLNDPDVTALWRELVNVGYTNLRPYRRNQRRFDEQRHAEARKQRNVVAA